jgi:hypothetical protein
MLLIAVLRPLGRLRLEDIYAQRNGRWGADLDETQLGRETDGEAAKPHHHKASVQISDPFHTQNAFIAGAGEYGDPKIERIVQAKREVKNRRA